MVNTGRREQKYLMREKHGKKGVRGKHYCTAGKGCSTPESHCSSPAANTNKTSR